jgi:hypothetical protein
MERETERQREMESELRMNCRDCYVPPRHPLPYKLYTVYYAYIRRTRRFAQMSICDLRENNMI